MKNFEYAAPKSEREVLELLSPEGGKTEVLAGGVSNRTVLVERPTGASWVVKQALPKLRVAVDWFSDPKRIGREALGLKYLAEIAPKAGLMPKDRIARAHCRAVSGEMHSGFYNLRSALPMNLKAHYKGFKIWAAAQADIDRVTAVWRECLSAYGGPYLFGATPTLADAMYAPVTTRFKTYDVKLDRQCADYCETILNLPDMLDWIEAAATEKAGIEELEAEF